MLHLRGMSPGHISLGETLRKQRLKVVCIQTNNFREQGQNTSLFVAFSAKFIMNQSRKCSLYPGKVSLKMRHLVKTRLATL